ncbi:E3 ubiquitin ligase [Olea europaea subsp. europaea]|uniref:E3 ubiquitin ligase n=1 Tax=Olea europaea subsp. europaea TaxID=158383 RepID=A0A8S0RCG2_OLEEU|nr:E3 ubiquitin ligase [Olea europaea subsp. europaea]
MASSQVEFASSSPFGCVLRRDHSRRNRCTAAPFQKNFNDLVRSCISDESSHPRHHIDYTDLWVHQPQWQTAPSNVTASPDNIVITRNGNDDNNKNNEKDRGKIKASDKDKWARAREMVFAGDRKNQGRVSSGSCSIPNLRGVSSLVQKWRDFEAEAKCSESNSPNGIEWFLLQWEEIRRPWREGEAQVANIIRKLTSSTKDNNNREQIVDYESSHLSGTLLDQSEQKRETKELEGLVARKAVSKFSQRGRIQALLRARFLRRGLEAREGRQVNSTSFEFKKITQSAIARIREQFKSDVQNGAIDSKNLHREVVDNAVSAENMLNQPAKQNQQQETNGLLISHKVKADHVLDEETSSTCQETNDSIISHEVTADIILDEETFTTSKEHEIELISQGVDENIQQRSLQAHGFEHLHQEASPFSDFMWQGTDCESNNRGSAESTEIAEPLIDVNKNRHAEEQQEVTSNQHLTRTNHDLIDDCSHQYSDCENKLLMGIDSHWVNVSHPEYERDWEDLRQARYSEMLDPFLENKDIHVLLERRSVSTFLSSGLRDRIDQLMMYRTQKQQLNIMNNLMEERGEEQVIEEEDKVEDDDAVELEEEEDEQDEERSYSDYYNEYEDESEIGQQYNDCIDQSPSSAPPSWLHNQVHEVSNDSYQAASSPSVQPSLSSKAYSQDNRPLSSSTNNHTIEMDLIYHLRGQMEQLHREMSKLRRSIKSCINMQVKLQCSIEQEAAAAICPSDQKARKDSRIKGLSKGRCRICCETEVDSVLYRCGHMCTCFKCAHEWQHSSGKCPICGAQILDVSKKYSYLSFTEAQPGSIYSSSKKRTGFDYARAKQNSAFTGIPA